MAAAAIAAVASYLGGGRARGMKAYCEPPSSTTMSASYSGQDFKHESKTHEEFIVMWQEWRAGSEESPQVPSLERVMWEKRQLPEERSADMSLKGEYKRNERTCQGQGAVPDTLMWPAKRVLGSS